MWLKWMNEPAISKDPFCMPLRCSHCAQLPIYAIVLSVQEGVIIQISSCLVNRRRNYITNIGSKSSEIVANSLFWTVTSASCLTASSNLLDTINQLTCMEWVKKKVINGGGETTTLYPCHSVFQWELKKN
jgi:hypothetical protein